MKEPDRSAEDSGVLLTSTQPLLVDGQDLGASQKTVVNATENRRLSTVC